MFSCLGTLQPTKSPRVPIGNSLPEYSYNLPETDRIYNEAVLHMKKENLEKTLDVLVSEYRTKIDQINNSNYEKSQEIYKIIENNFQIYRIELKELKGEIFVRVDQLLVEMQNATDVYIWSKTAPEPLFHGVDEKVIKCVTAIVKDSTVLNLMHKVRGEKVQLDSAIHAVQDESKSISKSIRNQDYYVVAKCCPDFWKMIYLTFFNFLPRRRSK